MATATANTITLGVTANYCKDWTIEDAIREIIANALDASKKLDISWNGGIATVRDYGKGFKATGLLIGESTKTASDIGQFGEGLKVGAMVLLRNGQRIVAESLGKRYVFTMESSIVGTPVLTIAISASTPFGKGTRVTFTCSEAELDSAKQRFLKLSPRPMFEKDILDHAGAIYVQGLLTDTVDSILGYNLHSKECMNRDRTTTNRDTVEREIGKLLKHCKSHDAIEKVIKWCGSDGGNNKIVEGGLYITSRHPRLWKKVFHEVYGKTACLGKGNTERAMYMGFQPVQMPHGIAYLLDNCGVANSDSATKKDASKSSRVTMNALQRANLTKAKRILQPIFEPDLTAKYSIRVCTMEANGEREGNVLRINVTQLDSLQATISTLLHEFCHLVSDAPDCSSAFERALTKYSGKLALALLERGNDRTTPKRVRKGVSSPSLPSIPIEDGRVAEGADKGDYDERGNGGRVYTLYTPDPTPLPHQYENEDMLQTVHASHEPEPTTPTIMQGSFGLPMENVTTYWGARAIYKPSDKYLKIDILHDRQSCLGEKPDRDELVAWLNATGMPWLKTNCKLYSDSRDCVEHRDGKFTIKATPNGSFGYLYIGAGILSI